AHFYIPEKVKEEREHLWKSYWDIHKENVFAAADKNADRLGFSGNAFSDFKSWIDRENISAKNNDSLARLIGLDNLIETKDGKTIFISTVVVKNENISEVKSELRAIAGIELFDLSETATSMLSMVKNDFDYLLLTASLIVFFTLLLIYGRIELTLLTFIPMVVSWIWILGFAVLLDIKFNFVNIVIATFIFGLGDDFCIFVTDGLLNKYKYSKNILLSYKSAIVLSAVTTIIGTGVLFFAKHPAIRSVAAISVLGITTILFLSLVLQPVLFNLFVQKRIEQKKTPVSFLTFMVSVFEFTYFVIGCFAFYFIGFILVILPLPKKQKRKLLNACISLFAWSIIYSAFYVHKKIFGKENLDVKKPSIIIANHSSFLDILLMIMLNPKIIILVKDWVYNSPLFGNFIRYAGYNYTETEAEENIIKIKSRIADGYSLMIFPEGSRSTDGKIHRFHKGAFYLAQELKLDITPILIHGASYVLPKSEYLVRRGELNLKILPRIKHNDVSWGTTYRERTKNISRYFKTEHNIFIDERESAQYLWNRLFNNYIFKGPLLEWYLRIKWKLESENFQYYNKLIENRTTITDIGCGYGYLSFYLHYKNRERKITGIDYDNDKIEIARNSFDKTDTLQFLSADITRTGFKEKQDVVFLHDVLHYLTKEEQDHVLQKCFDQMN
ncbi:MAG: 1-acyl-sn-glycerol-3-phosphate acyltransferase, partial [Bacteroidia bacterium]|nr:1-acyl-sn-glycerol-3-phosphate acyltransferase [Bacteroidia bacterium]